MEHHFDHRPGWRRDNNTYNSFKKGASVTNAAGKTTYTDDQSGDLTTTTHPTAPPPLTPTTLPPGSHLDRQRRHHQLRLHLAGNVDSVTDPDGRVTSYTLDAENQPTKTVYSRAGHPARR